MGQIRLGVQGRCHSASMYSTQRSARHLKPRSLKHTLPLFSPFISPASSFLRFVAAQYLQQATRSHSCPHDQRDSAHLLPPFRYNSLHWRRSAHTGTKIHMLALLQHVRRFRSNFADPLQVIAPCLQAGPVEVGRLLP